MLRANSHCGCISCNGWNLHEPANQAFSWNWNDPLSLAYRLLTRTISRNVQKHMSFVRLILSVDPSFGLLAERMRRYYGHEDIYHSQTRSSIPPFSSQCKVTLQFIDTPWEYHQFSICLSINLQNALVKHIIIELIRIPLLFSTTPYSGWRIDASSQSKDTIK